MAIPGVGAKKTQTGGDLIPLEQGPKGRPSGSGDTKSTLSGTPLEGGLKPASDSGTKEGVPLQQVQREQATRSPSPHLLRTKSDDEASLPWRVAATVGTILQHFAIRSPMVFISGSGVFLMTKYYFDQPALAVEATTFVLTAGAVYCLLRPFFLVTIPYKILSDSDKKHIVWREMINITNTVFIAATLASAVWGLKIPVLNGTLLWMGSFGLTYGISYKAFENIDKAAFFV